MRSVALYSAFRFAIAGVLIPLFLWGIIKSRDYGLIGSIAFDGIDNWAFQLLIMFAPLFYYTMAILQNQSLTAAYATAFGTNAALYFGVGILSGCLVRIPSAYYLLAVLIVASMLIGTDSWFLYRWLDGEESYFRPVLNDLDLRYFLVAGGLVMIFFIANARKERSKTPGSS